MLQMQDVQGRLQGSLGVIRLNREHRNNILTPNFTKQIKRSVETMNIDHSVKFIYLTTAKGQSFCNGTDFRTMMHFKAEGQTEQLTQYLG